MNHPHNASRSSRRNHRTVRCYGTFVSDDGKAMDINASVQGKRRYLQGTEVPVQQTDVPTADVDTDADHVIAGSNRAIRWFAGFFADWALIGVGAFCVVTDYALFGRSRASYDVAWEAAGRNMMLPALLVMIGAGIVGAGLSFLAGLFP